MGNSKNEMSNQTREESAANYIKEHRIEPLMNQLAESLIYKQPIDPRAYLIDLLQELIEAREKNTPPNGLLDRTNIAAIFGLIDIMGRGSISLRDALSALDKVGINIFSDVIQSQKKFLFEEQKKSWKKNKQTMLKKNRIFVSIILYFNKKIKFCKK